MFSRLFFKKEKPTLPSVYKSATKRCNTKTITEMKEANSFPNWFKNILIGFGVYGLLYIVSNDFAKHVPFIALAYPIVLYFVMLSEGPNKEDWKPNRAKYFTNISLSIIGFLALIQLLKYEYYVKLAGKLIIGANEISLTENYYARIAIYIFTLLFFIIAGSYFTFKTANRIKSFDGIGAFQAGKKIWNDAVVPIAKGQKLVQKERALKLFDKAIEEGFDNAEVFSLRASCLSDLGFYFDAISDYDEAISKNPKQGIASNYHMRSLVKDTIFDYKGSLADIEEAIRLSKLDSDDNRFWTEYAQTTGFNTATEFYEWQREMVIERLKLETRHPIDRSRELKFMKRR